MASQLYEMVLELHEALAHQVLNRVLIVRGLTEALDRMTLKQKLATLNFNAEVKLRAGELDKFVSLVIHDPKIMDEIEKMDVNSWHNIHAWMRNWKETIADWRDQLGLPQ